MANTRDTLGDQATLDGLVSRTLTSFEDDSVLTLREKALYYNTGLQNVNFPNLKTCNHNAFQYCTNLRTVNLPNCTSVGRAVFENCEKLENVSLPKITEISQYLFDYCTSLEVLDLNNITYVYAGFNKCINLKAIIIRAEQKPYFNGGLINTQLQPKGIRMTDKMGAVYVPSNLVNSYKSSLSSLIIEDIANYPIAHWGTISDSWAQIKAAESDGSYLTKYSIGDTKEVYVDDVLYLAEIIGFDLDSAADGSNDAHITWILNNLLPETHNMNSSATTSGGWENSEMRTYLTNTVLPTLDFKDYIVPVTKTFLNYNYQSKQTTTKSCTDSIWIPSAKEVGINTTVESSGCDYTSLFSSNKERIMYRNGQTSYWWLRTTYNNSSTYFVEIVPSGTWDDTTADQEFGILLGFCT